MPPSPWASSSPYHNDSSSHTAAPAPEPFSAAQRSAQARGKPFANNNNHNNATTHNTARAGNALRGSGSGSSSTPISSAESYALRERRLEAAAILDSEEMLMWYAGARYESVAQTRRFYTNVVLGMGRDEVVWREEWEVGGERQMRSGIGGSVSTASPKGKKGGGKGKGKERERERERERGATTTPRKKGV